MDVPGPPNGGFIKPGDFDTWDTEPPKKSNVTEWDWRLLGKVTPAKDQGEVSHVDGGGMGYVGHA